MRKLKTIVVALPLFAIPFGTEISNQVFAKEVGVKMKPGCPAGVVDRAIRKNIVPKSQIAPIQVPSAARTARTTTRPKVLDAQPNARELEKPAAGSGDCS